MTSEMEPSSSSDDKRDRLVSFLLTKANHGSFQCKSTFIADELGIPAWEVTAMMADIDKSEPELDIEELTYSRSTTWRVTCDSS
jgi:hypothetical protein